MTLLRKIALFPVLLLLFSCAPVLDRGLLKEGERDVSFSRLRQEPAAYKGRLYVFGGVIVDDKLTASGSQLEAMHVPVDRYGHFLDRGMSEGRFLAFLPADERLLDPEVFRKGRRITIAGEFMDLRQGKIDEMEYLYPVFRIKQVYLWPRERQYYPAYYYDPWFYPYPYFYGSPWWSYPYYGGYYYGDYYYGGTWRGPHRLPPQNVPPQNLPPSPGPRPHQAPGGAPGQAPAMPDRAPGRR